jgi:hypothetical protein
MVLREQSLHRFERQHLRRRPDYRRKIRSEGLTVLHM